jgi:hypothetical protein
VAILRADVNAEFATELAKLRAKLTEGDESWDELSKAPMRRGVLGRRSFGNRACWTQGMAKSSKRRWSGRVTRESHALALEPKVFATRTPRAIALSLKRSAERSRDPGPSRSAPDLQRSRGVERALRREPQSAASQRALATQAYRSAELRGAGARKAAQTKGAAGWSRAAKKAAQTRARRLA